jgi:hypothetical protein
MKNFKSILATTSLIILSQTTAFAEDYITCEDIIDTQIEIINETIEVSRGSLTFFYSIESIKTDYLKSSPPIEVKTYTIKDGGFLQPGGFLVTKFVENSTTGIAYFVSADGKNSHDYDCEKN